MAEERSYTRYQQNVIRRYYENRETLDVQRLGEIVSELYLTGPGKKADRLWAQAEKMLRRVEANGEWLKKTVKDRNVEQLAEMVKGLF